MPSCHLCMFEGESLLGHIRFKHKISSKEYKEKFPHEEIVSERVKLILLQTATQKRHNTENIKKAAIERSKREEYLRNLSESHKGNKLTDETKKKLSKISSEMWKNRTTEERIIIGQKISKNGLN
mgnify:CR=1 FL=1